MLNICIYINDFVYESMGVHNLTPFERLQPATHAVPFTFHIISHTLIQLCIPHRLKLVVYSLMVREEVARTTSILWTTCVLNLKRSSLLRLAITTREVS